MSLILGMGVWVFLAWTLTIIAAILCILYGIYHELIKKTPDEEPITKEKPQKKQPKKTGEK
jgi:uncharacterized BrkB/YihY/UPF0761 family membrane protein